MWETSERFRETIRGSHRAVVRVRRLDTVQFGAAPTGGLEVPLLSGSVRMSATADVGASLRAQVPGDWWDLVQPYGAELHVERGVDFGDGSQELVPLGYFRIDSADQPDAPNGPVDVEATDRTSTLQQVRIVYPYQVPEGTTHRTITERLVNGSVDGQGTYGMYPNGPTMPIDWTDAGYDPDTATISGDVVIDGYAYEWLAKMCDAKGAVIRFAPTGRLRVVARDVDPDAPAVYTVRGGSTGTLIRASRSVTRRGVTNMVRATGSDPAAPTGYRLAYITEATSPLRWNGPFGPALRYYASPLIRDSEGAAAAAETILAGSVGLPVETGLIAVPDPSLQPLDKVNSTVGGEPTTYVADELDIPLVGGGALQIRARTTNPVDEETSTDPAPSPVPDPGPDPTPDPDPDPGPGPEPSPSDGVQTAVLRGWGSVIAGDEFVGTTIDTAKWGLYNGPGHTGNGTRRPAAFSQANGILTITGDNNNQSGGAAFRHKSYGYRVECRIRCYRDGDSPGRDDRYHPVLILWPSNDNWPAGAEYDFLECDEGDDRGAGFMHLPNHQPYRQDHYRFDQDITQWFNMACEWNPAARTLKAWRNGEQVYSGTGRVADAPGPMHLTFQLDHFGGRPRRAKFDMAWARIYQKPNA